MSTCASGRSAAGAAEPRRISVVGDPRPTRFAASRPPGCVRRNHVRVRSRAGSAVARPRVEDRPAFSSAEKEAFYRTVAGALEHLPAVNLVVKVHPNEDETLLRRQTREWGWAGSVFTKTYDIHRLFAAADAAIMVTSMAGIEAMARGCPVVAVQTPGKDFEGVEMPPYVSENVVEHVDMGDAHGLAKALRRLLEDAEARTALVERARKFAARYDSTVDDTPGERLLKEIDEIRCEIAARRAP